MTIDEMIRRKRELGYSFKMIAELADLPLGTVQKVLGGYIKSPRKQTVDALERVLREDHLSRGSYLRETPGLNICGSGAADMERYTIEDYYSLPEGERAELIDGRICSLAAPSAVHQVIVAQVFTMINDFIKNNGGDCVPFISPVDVRIKADDYNMVEPDLIVVCDREKITEARIEGAPDLVVEVTSPSTAWMDNNIKRRLYREAGVREYWTIDPQAETVVVQRFGEGNEPGGKTSFAKGEIAAEIYSFDDKITAGIFHKPCDIDFSEIRKVLTRTFGNYR